MRHRALIQQLKSSQSTDVNPRAEWLKSNRALLLSQITNTLPVAKEERTYRKQHWQTIWSALSIFIPERIVYTIIRPIAVVLIAAIIVTSGSIGAVDAAYEALPGDWLYPAKRVTEKTQVAVAAFIGGKNAETKLHVEFAKRSAAEAKKIITQDGPNKTNQVASTVADLKSEISSITQRLDEANGAGNGTQLPVEVVQEVKQNAEQIKGVLQDVKNTLSATTSLENSALSKEVSETKDLVKDVSVKAVAVIVSKHLDGDQAISKKDAQDSINATLQDVVADTGEAKQNVDGVKTVVETAQTEAKGLASDAKKQSNSELATSTQQFADKVTAVANQTVAAVLKTEVVTAEVDKKVIEAKALISSGDLNKAVDRLKEANEASKAIEKISDNTLEKAQAVLPAVQMVKDSVGPGPTASVTTTLLKDGANNVALPLNVATTGTAVMTTTPALKLVATSSAVTGRKIVPLKNK